MRRDPDLVRELMLKLETLPVRPGGVVSFSSDDPEIAIEGRTAEDLDGHLYMIFDAGLAQSAGATPRIGINKWAFSRLTPAGHDFLDAVRDGDNWKATKAGAAKVGNWGIGFMAEIAKAVAKQKVKDLLGFDLG